MSVKLYTRFDHPDFTVPRFDFSPDQERDDHGRFAGGGVGLEGKGTGSAGGVGREGGGSDAGKTLSPAAAKILAQSHVSRMAGEKAKLDHEAALAKHAAMSNRSEEMSMAVMRMGVGDAQLDALYKERKEAFKAREQAEVAVAAAKGAVDHHAVPLATNIRGNTSPSSPLYRLAGDVMNLHGARLLPGETKAPLFASLRANAPLDEEPRTRFLAQVDALEKAHNANAEAQAKENAAQATINKANIAIGDHPYTTALNLAAGPRAAIPKSLEGVPAHQRAAFERINDELQRKLQTLPPHVRELIEHEGKRSHLEWNAKDIADVHETKIKEADELLKRSQGTGIDLLEPTHNLENQRYAREPSIDGEQYEEQQTAQKDAIIDRMGYEPAHDAFEAGERYTATFEHARLIRHIQAGTATKEMIDASNRSEAGIRADAKHLDMLTKQDLPQPTTVFRGIRMTREAAEQLSEQRAISFNAVASSTVMLHTAMEYVEHHKDEPGFENKKTGVLIELSTNRGFYASDSMAEITLPKDSYYAIKSVTRDVESGYVHIVAEDTHVGEGD